MDKKKFAWMAFVVFTLILGVLVTGAHARDYGKGKGHRWDIEDRFSYRAHFILQNQEELGLSDEQTEKIKDLKNETKKDLIRKNAEIDILAIDIKAEMRKDAINTNTVNKLIDKKYDFKKEKEKSLVNAYAAFKDILTEEQKQKMKDLRKKCKKEKMKASMMKGKMGHPMMGDEARSHMMGR